MQAKANLQIPLVNKKEPFKMANREKGWVVAAYNCKNLTSQFQILKVQLWI